jgi:hypothetical protein
MTWEDIQGWFNFGDAYDEAVARAVASGRPNTFVEVGCFLGRSLCYLGRKSKAASLSPPGKKIRVIGVDTCRGSGVEVNAGGASDHHAEAAARGGGTFAGELHKNVIDCGLGDVVEILVAESFRAASLFRDESLDFVLLDARHDYESVAIDIVSWLPKVRSGGVLAGDDYTPVWPGVVRAVDELLPRAVKKPLDTWWYEVP